MLIEVLCEISGACKFGVAKYEIRFSNFKCIADMFKVTEEAGHGEYRAHCREWAEEEG